MRELSDNKYAGCNLLIADRESVVVVEAADVLKSTRLTPGLHLVANGAFDAPDDPRIRRVRTEFERVRGAGVEEWFNKARRVCPLSADGNEPAICLTGPDRGTVSSTVLGIARHPADSRYWYAPGPPNSTPYEDYTPLFREMLTGGAGQALPEIEPPEDSPARRAVRQGLTHRPKARGASGDTEPSSPYRILLRGPWKCEPLARAKRDPAGALEWSQTELPPAGTVRLPAVWHDLVGDFRGRVRFQRRFHPPSNIAPGDRLFIVLDAVAGTGPVLLNGHSLGSIEAPGGATRFEVTGLLQVNNDLVLEVEYTGAAAPGGQFGHVALEIHSTVS
jgi:hypothetical protein